MSHQSLTHPSAKSKSIKNNLGISKEQSKNASPKSIPRIEHQNSEIISKGM
jgi:hypothetical protein